MCRWAAYLGAPIFLSEVVSDPSHSLIEQSREADECKTRTNADGFGLAWYDARPEPGLYRDVYPAWSDPNLRALASQVRSGLFLSHIRASTGTAISRNNCHPFAVGTWSFMHNGQIGGFENFRKQADMLIPDDLYPDRRGATDSEVMFLLALANGLHRDARGAMEASILTLEALSRERGAGPHMRVAAAFSNGTSLFAIRYASDSRAPSLYYRWSDELGGWTVVSEPLERDQAGWIEVPPGSFCTFLGKDVSIQPFLRQAKPLAA